MMFKFTEIFLFMIKQEIIPLLYYYFCLFFTLANRFLNSSPDDSELQGLTCVPSSTLQLCSCNVVDRLKTNNHPQARSSY